MPNEGSKIRPPTPGSRITSPASPRKTPNQIAAEAMELLEAARNLKGELKAGIAKCINWLLEEANSANRPQTQAPVDIANSVVMAKLERQTSAIETLTKNIEDLREEQSKDAIAKMQVTKTVQEMAKAQKLEADTSAAAVTAIQVKLQDMSGAFEENKYSYAAALTSNRKLTSHTRSGEERHAVIISSDDPLKTSEEVEGIVKRSVNVRALGIGVSRVTKASNQKLVIALPTRRDKDRFMEELGKSSGKGLSAKEGENRNPKIALVGLIKGVTDDDIRSSIDSQNKLDLQPDGLVRLCYRRRHRNTLLCTVVYEITPLTYQILINANKVSIGYQRIPIVEETPLIQCFNCLGFGHTRKFCEGKLSCSHCTEEHIYRVCPNKESAPTCSNCTEGQNSHNAMSDTCPVRNRMETRARERVNYQC